MLSGYVVAFFLDNGSLIHYITNAPSITFNLTAAWDAPDHHISIPLEGLLSVKLFSYFGLYLCMITGERSLIFLGVKALAARLHCIRVCEFITTCFLMQVLMMGSLSAWN